MIQAIFSYFKEVRTELAKVEWPKAGNVIKLTVMVIIITLFVGIYVGGLDLGFTKLLELVLSN